MPIVELRREQLRPLAEVARELGIQPQVRIQIMATYNRECVGLAETAGGYTTRAAATADFFACVVTYYNRVRLHSALGYQSPVDFENQIN